MLNIKSFLASLTHHPGVYQMLDEHGKILYIGKASSLKKRLSSYFSSKQQDIKTHALLKHVKDIQVTVTNSENEALILECNLIKKFRPHYNVLFRDDKSYPYIVITVDDLFPRIDFYRGTKKRSGKFFGPFPNSMAVRETINLIEKLFRLRTCTNHFFAGRQRPCLQYQIGRCTGPCVDLVSPEEYQQQVRHAILFLEGKNDQVINEINRQMEQAASNLNFELASKFRDQLIKLREIQSKQHVSAMHGDVDVIGYASAAGMAGLQLLTIRHGRILGSQAYFPNAPADSLIEEILASFIAQHYLSARFIAEDIPKEIIMDVTLPEQDWLANALGEKTGHKVSLLTNVRGERKKWLEIATNSAQQAVTTHMISKVNLFGRFTALQTLLELKAMPNRIECFDISHTMGELTVGSCVVFNPQGPVKSDYRRFNISNITPGDDLAAMEQALRRRYKRLQTEQSTLPDILLIDGGVNQLHVAQKILSELDIHAIQIIGVAKGPTRKPGFETLHFTNGALLHLPPDSLALHLIQQIRDEAHRFAITGHRMRRDKKRRTSSLESIPGVGAKRRRELLQYFGGIQAVNRASLEELAKVPGVGQSLAERIYAALHNVVI